MSDEKQGQGGEYFAQEIEQEEENAPQKNYQDRSAQLRASLNGLAMVNAGSIMLMKAIKEKEHWDNIFIYSDMQAGHGGLYGKNSNNYKDYRINGSYIDVAKLIDTYRKTVNPKVNVFCVQTAGYNNVLIPETGYRTSVLYGWTGKELIYADTINKFWDETDQKVTSNQNP